MILILMRIWIRRFHAVFNGHLNLLFSYLSWETGMVWWHSSDELRFEGHWKLHKNVPKRFFCDRERFRIKLVNYSRPRKVKEIISSTTNHAPLYKPMVPILILTVTSFLTQSSQNFVAENFFLVTAVLPSVMVTPRQTWAAEWYIGRTEYKMSSS